MVPTRRQVIGIAVLPSLAFTAEGTITVEEREKVMRYFKESREQFLQSIDAVSEAQWKWKPTPERWSVGEVSEHIVLAEAALFSKVRDALSKPTNPDWEAKTKGKTEFIEKVMPNRMGKAKAPDEIVPEGKFTAEQIRARFAEGRNQTETFARETTAALKAHTSEHPFPIFNTLSAWQWLIYVPLHTMRHVKQIDEVKGTAGYPVA